MVLVFNIENRVNNFKLHKWQKKKLDQVDEFLYFGRMFTKHGKIGGEIFRGETDRNVRNMGSCKKWIFVLKKKAKMAVYQSVLLHTLLYGSECWVSQEKHKSKLNAVGRSVWCVGWIQNKWLLWKKYIVREFGCIERMNEGWIAKQIHEERVNGSKERKRQRKSWLNEIDKIRTKRDVIISKKQKAM